MTVYLDDNASTRVDPRVVDCMVQVMQRDYGNSGSLHAFGQRAKDLINDARAQVGGVVGVRRHEVLFTSGATESNNLAILGLAQHGIESGKRHIVSTQIEHKAVLEPLEALGRRGFEITLLPPDERGKVSAEQVLAAVRADTLLVSVMHVNNETGAIQPVGEIAERLASSSTLLHVDAAQGFGKVLSDLQHPGIDLMSVSGHKIHGPQGVGALIARRRQNSPPPLTPLMFGGGQELGFRPGTLPTPLVTGFGLAAQLAVQEHEPRQQHWRRIGNLLSDALASLNVVVHGDQAGKVPNVLNASVVGVSSDQTIDALHDLIAVSDGSACTSVCATASHVLTAMRVPNPLADCAIRMSWSHLTDEDELRRVLPEVVARLQSLQQSAADGA